MASTTTKLVTTGGVAALLAALGLIIRQPPLPPATSLIVTATHPPIRTQMQSFATLPADLPADQGMGTDSVSLARRQPSNPPIIPYVCTAADLAFANQLVQSSRNYGFIGYEYLLATSPSPRGWCGLIHQMTGDPALWLCDHHYDSPGVKATTDMTFDYQDFTPDSKLYPYIFLAYHGHSYAAHVDPAKQVQTVTFEYPCWADDPVAKGNITFGDIIPKLVTVPRQ